MIPETKTAAVKRALREAFDASEFEDIRMMTAGMSTALVFRIVVHGRPYLLRIITRDDVINDPTRQFACMKSGAEAGLAPRVRYASIEDRVSITDFVEARPFPRAEALRRMPPTLRVLHALPRFPKMSVYPTYLDAADAYVRKLRDAKILPENEVEELLQLHERIAGVYPRDDADMVSCHNDLKPENVLYDGDHVWLVDWEAAFLNDRYVDLAVVANFVVTNEEEEEVLLETYFGESPSDYRRARFYLMSQILHVFYASIFALIGTAGKPIDSDVETPAFRDLHDEIWAGKISLKTGEAKLQYARVHWRQALENQHSRRFQEALRIVASSA